MEPDLLGKLADKSITKEEMLRAVESDFELVPLVVGGVSSSKAAIRYGCAKVLVDLTAEHLEKMYSQMDFFISLLDSKYRILVWNALAAIANLCVVDVDKKFDAIFDKYYDFLNDEYMVTVANVVGNSAKIALTKPYLIPRVTAELLRVDKISTSAHLTDECRRVIAEHAIKSFSKFFDKMGVEEKVRVLSFVKSHVGSSRVTLAKEAERFLAQHNLA